MRSRIMSVLGAAAIVAVMAMPQMSAAAKFPTRAITWLVNANPGGGFDLHSRAVARVMRQKLGVNIIVKNVPGAGGIISWNLLWAAKPDGYTVGIVNLPGGIVGELFRGAQYKLRKFEWVGRISAAPYVWAVGKQYSFRTLKDFQQAKEVLIPNSGVGSTAWINAALTAATMKFNGRFISGYRGAPAATMGVVRGEGEARPLGLDSPGQMSFVKDGSLIPTWVYLKERDPDYPNVPTVGELGYAKLNVLAANRVVAAPPGTPDDRMAILIKAFKEAIEDPATQQAFKDMKAKTAPIYGKAWMPEMQTMFELIEDNKEVFKKALK